MAAAQEAAVVQEEPQQITRAPAGAHHHGAEKIARLRYAVYVSW